jgi:hypothetical protein
VSAPNIASPTTINGKTAHLALTNTAADIIAAVATSHAVHVQRIICANKTAAAHPVSIFHKAGGTSYDIATSISIPANSTLELPGVWLEEGDSLTGNSDASSQITVNVPYEDFT